VTANPDAAWATQQARNLLLALEERRRRVRFLLRDRDAKFCRAFDDVFRAEGTEVLLTPVQAPNANAHAERWVRTVRAECLDWLLIVGRGHLDRVLRVYVAHYTGTVRIARLSLSRRILQPMPGPSPRLGRVRCTGMTCSAGCRTSTSELHERIYAPYGHRPTDVSHRSQQGRSRRSDGWTYPGHRRSAGCHGAVFKPRLVLTPNRPGWHRCGHDLQRLVTCCGAELEG
jgi:hypothetical protein